MANYKNFSISRPKAKFYEKAKQPTEGYEEVTYGTEGKKTYHKYQDRVKGYPDFFGAKEVPFEGRTLKFLELSLKDGDTINKISVPLKNTKGAYTDEARKIISMLNSADLNEEIEVSLKLNTFTKKNGKEGEDINIYGNYTNRKNEDGHSLSTGYIPYADIPKAESKVVAGDTVWDFTPQTEFFYAKLQEVEKRFKDKGNSKPQESNFTAKAGVTTVITYPDDLPF